MIYSKKNKKAARGEKRCNFRGSSRLHLNFSEIPSRKQQRFGMTSKKRRTILNRIKLIRSRSDQMFLRSTNRRIWMIEKLDLFENSRLNLPNWRRNIMKWISNWKMTRTIYKSKCKTLLKNVGWTLIYSSLNISPLENTCPTKEEKRG